MFVYLLIVMLIILAYQAECNTVLTLVLAADCKLQESATTQKYTLVSSLYQLQRKLVYTL